MSETQRSTRQWQKADIDRYLHPFTDYRELAEEKALIVERGAGCHVWDSDGNKYLDGLAGLACVQVGYGRCELADAAARQMRELAYFNSFFKSSNHRAIELAEKLVELTPAGLNRVFYVNDGSEANDTCIRMARHFWTLQGKPEKHIIIGREFGYHGSTIAAAQLTGMPWMHAQAASLPGFAHIPSPHKFLLGRGLGDEEFGIQAAAWLEAKIQELGAERVAAFVAEPLQGAGGGKMPPRSYWPEIQRICKQYDVLLVVDEVVCGFGRTGAWFGSDTYAITDIDLMCLAKGITSGYIPLGAVMVNDRIADTLIDHGGEFYHGFTWSGHPVACAVALENIAILEREQLIDRVTTDIGPCFGEGLQVFGEHPVVGEVRVCGMVGAVELVANRDNMEPLQPEGEVGELFKPMALRHGIITRPIGETILLTPPLVINHGELDFLMQQFGRSLDDFQRYLASR